MGHDLVTAVNYYDDPGDGSDPTPVFVGGKTVTNKRALAPVAVTVVDIAGREGDFSLDAHGFQFHRHSSGHTGAFDDEDALCTEYYKECEDLVKEITGAGHLVLAFDHKVRRGPSYWHKLGQNNAASRGPLHRAHVDQSYNGALMRLREVATDEELEEPKLLSHRWQIINVSLTPLQGLQHCNTMRVPNSTNAHVWRPIKTVYKDPLAVADATSVSDTDLVAASIIYTKLTRRMESWTVKHNPDHRWYFKYAQEPDEVVLFKCFDSDETAAARRVPHCAVEDPDHIYGECRESVEVRCMVFF
ncbi:hypothetical protein B0H63DRAFT_386950 [Podospora didyma]|uniref:Uncharacterized protein n=1 Tax=Podospora didyma TaxID=330526 RepID=A0AAE0P500_9PEZI|nr:hypothetical protein B0H63DRAFT_386950 [Podospora didyma]